MVIQCPVSACGAEVSACAARCDRCGADLRAYMAAVVWPDICFNRALELARHGDAEGAQQYLAVTLTLRPDDDEATLLAATLAWSVGRVGPALRGWRQVANRQPAAPLARRAEQCLAAVTQASASQHATGDRQNGPPDLRRLKED